MNFYKGYIRTIHKAPCEKFKDGNELKSLEDVQKYDEFAGVLAEGTVLIDLDDGDQAEILMKVVEDLQTNCRVLQTTRGKHFLFTDKDGKIRKCYTHVCLACGLVADIKVGLKNSLEVLKYDGKERFCEWEETDDQTAEVPVWLLPIESRSVPDFLNLGEGDGRNQALFNYILTLQSAGFTKDEARETLRIINKYVLKNPLPDPELETVMRDGAFQKPMFFNGRTFLHDTFGNVLKSQFYIRRINGQLHAYDEGIYKGGDSFIESKMVQIYSGIRTQQRNEVLRYLNLSTLHNESPDAFSHLIAFRNGVFDIKQNCMVPFDPSFIITNKIPWDYNAEAYSEVTDRTLNKLSCNDPQIRDVLEEMIGYCLYRRDSLQKSFILTGTGANGKSTFLNMLKSFLGCENFSSLDIAELADRFSTEMITGKLANIGDDISDDSLRGKQLSIFKKIVTGESIKAEQKGLNAYNFKPYCKLLFSANEIPRMGFKGFYAIKRRFVIIPFEAVFSKDDEDYDAEIEDKLIIPESMEYLGKIGISGLQRALQNRGFTESQKTADQLKQFEKDNDPVVAWMETVKEDHYLEREPLSTLFANYQTFCIENGYSGDIQLNKFSERIQKMTGLSTKRITTGGVKRTWLVPS